MKNIFKLTIYLIIILNVSYSIPDLSYNSPFAPFLRSTIFKYVIDIIFFTTHKESFIQLFKPKVLKI